jgi:hypothetical protein
MTGDFYILRSIKTQVQQGEYRVDPLATADAMIRWFSTPAHRRRGARGPYRPGGAQNECSNPDSGSSASTNRTPGGPSTTDPIQVRPLFDGGSA